SYDGGADKDTVSYELAQSGVHASLANQATNSGPAGGDAYTSIENLVGSNFNDRIEGAAGNNELYRLAGDATLLGGGGDDMLHGGGGNDTLIGGAGDDTYFVQDTGSVVMENPGEGTDTVMASVSFTLPDDVENLQLVSMTDALNGTGNDLDNVISG